MTMKFMGEFLCWGMRLGKWRRKRAYRLLIRPSRIFLSLFGLPKGVHRKSHAGRKAAKEAAPKEAAAAVAGVVLGRDEIQVTQVFRRRPATGARGPQDVPHADAVHVGDRNDVAALNAQRIADHVVTGRVVRKGQ